MWLTGFSSVSWPKKLWQLVGGRHGRQSGGRCSGNRCGDGLSGGKSKRVEKVVHPLKKTKKKVILSFGDHKYLTDFGHDLKLGLSNYDYIIFFTVM
jgi:hypothetical protein